MFFGNKSGRNEAGKMKAFMANKDNPLPTPCTLNIRYIKKEFGWHVPVIIKCSEPFDQSKCVGDDVILAEIEKFSNPAAGEEKVDEADAPTDRVR